jgi:hypothetical protein
MGILGIHIEDIVKSPVVEFASAGIRVAVRTVLSLLFDGVSIFWESEGISRDSPYAYD